MRVSIGEKRVFHSDIGQECYPIISWGSEIAWYYPQWNHGVIVKLDKIRFVDDIIKAIGKRFGVIPASYAYKQISFVQ